MSEYTTKQINAETKEEFVSAMQEEKDDNEYQEALKGVDKCVNQGERRFFSSKLHYKFSVGDGDGKYNDQPAG